MLFGNSTIDGVAVLNFKVDYPQQTVAAFNIKESENETYYYVFQDFIHYITVSVSNTPISARFPFSVNCLLWNVYDTFVMKSQMITLYDSLTGFNTSGYSLVNGSASFNITLLTPGNRILNITALGFNSTIVYKSISITVEPLQLRIMNFDPIVNFI